jgi:hypothetical protein
MKVSVFNDDKRTELIGETIIDLSKVVIPGGGQSDQWHSLRCKGKYAGEVRIEMTYYDTRPEDEAVIERRKVDRKVPVGSNGSLNSKTSSLSGPRELNIKRRPLPDNPTISASGRPPLTEPIPRVPATAFEGNNQSFPQPYPQDLNNDINHYDPSTQPASRVYEPPEDASRDRSPYHHRVSGPTQTQGPSHPPNPRMLARDSLPDTHHLQHDLRHSQPGQPEYHDTYPETHYTSRDPPPIPATTEYNQDIPLQTDDLRHREAYDIPQMQDDRMVLSHSSYRQPMDHFIDSRQPLNGSYHQGEVLQSSFDPTCDARTGSFDPDSRHLSNNQLSIDWPRDSAMSRSLSRETGHQSYASMQPTVEDEQEDAFAPPPPVHRSPGHHPSAPPPTSQISHGSTYGMSGPIGPGQARPPVSVSDVPSVYQDQQITPRNTDITPARPHPPYGHVSGAPNRYEPKGPTGDMGRPVYENRPAHSSHHERGPEIYQSARRIDNSPHTTPIYTPYQSPSVRDERDAFRNSRSTSPDTRVISRKSVSPRPSIREDRNSPSIPFSPDSYNSFHPQSRGPGPISTREGGTRGDFSEGGTSPRVQADDHRDEEIGPIIGDDGREIDPSDHLPSDTWAPEPERKSKKPEVIIRFKHAAHSSTHGPKAPPREIRYSQPTAAAPPTGVMVRTGRNRLQKAHGRPPSYGPPSPNTPSPMNHNPHPTEYDPPTESPGHQRNYSTTHTHGSSPQHSRRSVSPTPSPYSMSNYFDSPQRGPPLPAKVPIAQPVNQNHPGVGMDALSQEIQSIDIGSVGYGSGRGRRQSAPRPTVLSSDYNR